MTKRASIKARQKENQADLFGAGPTLPLPKAGVAKTTRTPSPSRPNPGVQVSAPGALLNVRQAAARLGLSKSTLDKMRGAGKGPRFVKSTDRAIRYDPVDLDRWISARRSTSD